jgi:leucyl aminopeptidase
MNRFSNQEASIVKRVLLAGTVILVVAGISACGAEVDDSQSVQTATSAAPQVAVSELIAQAEAGLAQATALGHAWTVTRPLIDEATATLQAGDMVRARELAERALATAVASIEQADLEAQSWRSRVPQ